MAEDDQEQSKCSPFLSPETSSAAGPEMDMLRAPSPGMEDRLSSGDEAELNVLSFSSPEVSPRVSPLPPFINNSSKKTEFVKVEAGKLASISYEVQSVQPKIVVFSPEYSIFQRKEENEGVEILDRIISPVPRMSSPRPKSPKGPHQKKEEQSESFGQLSWNMQDEDYDYKQEVARSSYADMLHDGERNNLYYEGIRRCVALLRSQKRDIHVLDIGTGTGLLSMMALSCGVDSVTACEAFTPMATCARKIFELNGFSDKVNLISKRSTEIECGEGKEMPRRANLLVTEVFDTELIGEGANETFSHAKEHLLTPDALIVPSEGTMYAQVISSDLIKRWNKLSPILDPSPTDSKCETLVSIPDSLVKCPGAAAVHDIQLSEVPRTSFSPVSEPIQVFQFDWSGRKIPLSKNEVTHKSFKSLISGSCDAVFMWWDLKMDPCGEVVLSCAPVWDHPLVRGNPKAKSSELPWRDHWMQAVYYFPKSLRVEASQDLTLVSSHDEYSVWFNIAENDVSSMPPPSASKPLCECGLHATVSRTRLGQLSDPRRVSTFVNVLKRHVTRDSVCLFIGDCCLVGVAAATLGARHVYIHQTSGVATRVLNDFIAANGVEGKVSILASHLMETPIERLVAPISLVFSEPYFDTSMLPWHSLQLLYRIRAARKLLSSDVVILPSRLVIRALPVQFRDLWKIRSSLHVCSGFKMQPFDEMIERASEEADERVEPQPLWEYPGTALGSPFTLFSLSLSQDTLHEVSPSNCVISADHPGTLNGLALWAEWQFGEEDCLSTGPVKEVTVGEEVEWDMYSRQGVYLFKDHLQVSGGGQRCRVTCNTSFDPSDGLVNFEIGLEEEEKK